ncbi:MAG: asparagine--tRNA ligase [Candidatus Delongbacteria bacterium]|nr:asparagine--tRNA ligase [Candidatus Delongbacteria bacterium]
MGSERLRIRRLLEDTTLVGREVSTAGWIRTNRTGKTVSFIELNDGSCQASIQLVYGPELIDNFEEIGRALTGSCLQVTGTLVASAGSGQSVEIHLQQVTILGSCDSSYPLQKKRHSFEFLRTISHLRPRTNTFGAVFRVRSRLAYSIHRFFQDRGFVYVHTPIITGNDAEGAGEMFRVSTLDPATPPRLDSGAIDWSKDFFGRETNLTVSGQLNGEMFALALCDIYTFGPTFRAENSHTSRHASEFWMIEPEMAFYDLAANCELAGEFLRYLINDLLENCAEDMAFFDQWIRKGLLDSLRQIASSPFERLTYTDAIKALEASGKKFEFPVAWGKDLQSEHERWLTEEYLKRPVFVTDYPKEIKAFYMRRNDDGRTVAAMDLLVPGVGEIIGGSQREERLDVLVGCIEALGQPLEAYEWYLDSRRFGSAPHAGFGLGFERMIMYATGMENIRDVMPFPRTPGSCDF